MIWFTSDTHFDHANILKYTNRPFASIDEMNETLVANWNALVVSGDVVYHLGDFAFHRHAEFAKRLNGVIVLVEGSHDRMSAKERKAFTWVGPRHEIKLDDNEITLSHYAMRTWPKSHYGTWHLYGHSHGNLPPLGKSFDVGVDAWDLKPINIEQVKAKMDSLPTLGILLSCRPKGSGVEITQIHEHGGTDERYEDD